MRYIGTAPSVLQSTLDYSLRSAKPLRIRDSSVEVVTGLVKLVLTRLGGSRRFGEKGANLGLAHGLKAARCLQRLIQDGQGITAGDHHAGWQIHRIG